MATNTEIKANNNESGGSVVRRFSRRVKSSGVINKAKSLRYSTRKISKTMQKKQALRTIKKRTALDKLIKLGKAKDKRQKQAPMTKEDGNKQQ